MLFRSPLADRHLDYARQVRDQLADAGLRVEVDERVEKIGYKIREAQLQKVPYMLVVGDREAEAGHVAVRARTGGEVGSFAVEDVIGRLRDEVRDKRPSSTLGAAP